MTTKQDIQNLISNALKDKSVLSSGSHPPDLGTLIQRLVDERKAISTEPSTLAAKSQQSSAPSTGMHQKWSNQLSNQVVEPLQYWYPKSLNDPTDKQSLISCITQALVGGTTVKAAGSGHSYSDVATTPGFFVDTHGLCAVSSSSAPITGQLSQDVLQSPLSLALSAIDWPSYDPENNHALIEVEAGITIKNLNQELQNRNLGLMNMGGYDGQTIMGAISTSTHGSGIGLGPFPDMLRSLVLATTGTWNGESFSGSSPSNGVNLYRIEPSQGITDPKKYSDPQIKLIQDDACFQAAICNMGCFGVVYSIVLEVMQMYWLEENRTITTLDQVFSDLAAMPSNAGSLPSVLQSTRNYEVLVHPYPLNGLEIIDIDSTKPPETYYPYFKCLVTSRNIVPKPDTPSGTQGNRNCIAQMLAQLTISFELLVSLMNLFPEIIPYIIDLSLDGLVDTNYIAPSFDIYNLGLNQDAGFATEIGFSLEDANSLYTSANFKAAIDKIHTIAQRSRILGQQYQTSPFSIRFVKSSDASLSMMQGVNTCMIEMDMVTGTYAGPEIMMRYQDAMYDLGGRPHWGLEFDHLTGSNQLIASMYPKLASWLSIYQQMNQLGTFDNSFTDRVGFSVKDFVR